MTSLLSSVNVEDVCERNGVLGECESEEWWAPSVVDMYLSRDESLWCRSRSGRVWFVHGRVPAPGCEQDGRCGMGQTVCVWRTLGAPVTMSFFNSAYRASCRLHPASALVPFSIWETGSSALDQHSRGCKMLGGGNTRGGNMRVACIIEP